MRKIIFGLFVVASLLQGESLLNINLNEKDIEFSLDSDERYSNNTKIYKSFGFLKGEDENEEMRTMVEGQMMVMGLTAIPGLSVGMGLKGMATRITDVGNDDLNAGAAALKVKVIYTLPLLVKSYITGSYAYAPESLSFSDLKNYNETRVEADFEIIDGGMIYGGVRQVDLDFKDIKETYTLNNNAYVGLKFVF
ncbi:MAG: YfaZ family protein [Campylobacterales bacterium]|nr:YfaZ family protein [Campylobacterales bacterium]